MNPSVAETKTDYKPGVVETLTDTITRSVMCVDRVESHNDWSSGFAPAQLAYSSKQSKFYDPLAHSKLVFAEQLTPGLFDLTFESTTFSFASEDVWGSDDATVTSLDPINLFGGSPFPHITLDLVDSSAILVLEMVVAALSSPSTDCQAMIEQEKVRLGIVYYLWLWVLTFFLFFFVFFRNKTQNKKPTHHRFSYLPTTYFRAPSTSFNSASTAKQDALLSFKDAPAVWLLSNRKWPGFWTIYRPKQAFGTWSSTA